MLGSARDLPGLGLLGAREDTAQAGVALVSETYMQCLAVCWGPSRVLCKETPRASPERCETLGPSSALSAGAAQAPELETSREASKAGRLLQLAQHGVIAGEAVLLPSPATLVPQAAVPVCALLHHMANGR